MIDPRDLHALADGELSKAEAARLRELLKSDSHSENEFNAILNLKDCLRERAVTHSEDECWRVCVGRLNELDRARKVEGFVGKYSWAICGALFLTIIGGRFAMRGVHGDSARTADLARVFPSFGGSKNATATPEQSQLVKELFKAADSAVSDRLQVTGGFRGEFQGQEISRFDLRDGVGRLELFVLPAQVNFEDTSQTTDDPNISVGVISAPNAPSGHVNCLIWKSHGETLVLAGPRTPEDLESVVSTHMAP